MVSADCLIVLPANRENAIQTVRSVECTNTQIFQKCRIVCRGRKHDKLSTKKNPILGMPNTSYFDTYQVYAPLMGTTSI